MNKDHISILYVENEQEARHLVVEILKKLAINIYTASSAIEGIQIYKEKKPDIVLTDIMMPGMNGIEMIKKIREINRKTKIIVISAWSEKNILLESIEAGIDGYLPKPIINSILINEIEKQSESILLQRKLEQKEREVIENAEKYRSLVESTNVISWELDNKTKEFTYVSPQTKKILGYDPVEWKNLDFWASIIHPDDREYATRFCAGETLQKRDHDFEYRVITKKGEIKWLKDIVKVIEQDGEVTYLKGNLVDITKEKEEEQKRKQSEEKFEYLFNIQTDAIFIHDLKGNFIEVNEACYKLLGYTKDEFLKLNISDISLSESEDQIDQQKKQLLLNGNIFFTSKQKTKNGALIPSEVHLQIIDYKNEKAILGVVRNITEKITTENELKKSEEKYRLLFENMTSGFALHEMVYDKNGIAKDYKYIEANPAFEKLTGIPIKEISGKTVKQLLPNIEQYWIDTYNMVATSGKPIKFLNYANDLNKYYETYAFSPKKGQFAVVFNDVTKRLEAEKEKNKLFTAIEQSPATIVITDTEGNIEYVNPQFTKKTGYTFHEAHKSNTRILKSGKNPDKLYEVLWATIKSGETWFGEFINKKKNGEEFIESAIITPVKNNNGIIENYIAIKQDITEQEEIKKNLLNKTRALSILSDINFAISKHEVVEELLEKILNTIVLEGGYSFTKIYWYDGAIYKSILQSGIECDCLQSSVIDIKKLSKEITPIELCIQKNKIIAQKFESDNYNIWVKSNQTQKFKGCISLPINVNKKLIGVISICPTSKGYFLDNEIELFAQLSSNISFGINAIITKEENKKKQQRIIASEKEFRNLFNAANDAILIQDTKTEFFIEVNERAIKSYKIKRDEFLKLKPINLIVEFEKKNYKERFKVIKEKGKAVFRTFHKRSDGKQFPVEISASKIIYLGKRAVLLFIRDITERERLQKQTLRSAIQAEEVERSRIARELHDGISPILSTIKLFTQTLSESKNKELKEHIHSKIEESIEEAIISLTEISNNVSPHILQNFGLSIAIERFAENVTKTSKVKVHFSSNMEKRLDKNIETILYRVTTELINNCLKHAQATKLDIKINHIAQKIILSYNDNGKGFELKKAFDQKKGMGLFNIINRVNSINGQIEFLKGKGTNIIITVLL